VSPESGRAVAGAIIGGTASVIGGGKFENGAVTGAFGYLFSGGVGALRQTLSYTTVGGGPGLASWSIQWGLSQPSPDGGYIVQEISGEYTATQGGEMETRSYHYWEAWQVPAGSQITRYNLSGSPADDVFRINGNGATGTDSSTAAARFYEGLSLPPSFVPNNRNTFAGSLPATNINPNLPIGRATPPVVRTYNTQF